MLKLIHADNLSSIFAVHIYTHKYINLLHMHLFLHAYISCLYKVPFENFA